ncbi:hypothetical protein FQA47_021597 [Oryzias melastigma]|uniref:Uncharacterized protein n=1 Tax=Oryzias melastigma TaxID=30732 RepID=A0A834BZX6_ORYME|nr:hypothetical protein FQA47_021597 [Oryzias melastigma]
MTTFSIEEVHFLKPVSVGKLQKVVRSLSWSRINVEVFARTSGFRRRLSQSVSLVRMFRLLFAIIAAAAGPLHGRRCRSGFCCQLTSVRTGRV